MKKSNLDEMQEQKLLQIEHNGMWIAFWGLTIAILFQVCIGLNSPLQIAGELILLLILCIYTLIACFRHGIWDRRLKPNAKTNFILSLIAGIVVFIFNMLKLYLSIGKVLLLPSILTGVSTFILCFVMLEICAKIYKSRLKKLESE